MHSSKKRSICTKSLDPREYQNWARLGTCNLLLARHIWSWDQNHVHEQWQSSLLGQKFSWVELNGHEFEQQCAGNLRSAVRKICVKIGCEVFHMPIKSQSKTTKTRTCRFVQKNNSYWVKNLDWCWTGRIFTLWLCSIEEIDPSSSSWISSASRRWWSSWILENPRK